MLICFYTYHLNSWMNLLNLMTFIIFPTAKQEDETTKNDEQKSKRDSRFDAIYTDPDFATAKVVWLFFLPFIFSPQDEEAEEKEDEKFLEQYDNVDDGSEDMEEEEEETEGRKPRMYEQTVSLWCYNLISLFIFLFHFVLFKTFIPPYFLSVLSLDKWHFIQMTKT